VDVDQDQGRIDRPDIDTVWRAHRPFLVDLAFRMLGNFSSAEDVVQEAFGRLLRVDLDGIHDVRGWLVVVVSRLCLDDLRSARSRRQDLGADPDEMVGSQAPDPADRVTLDDEVRMALLVVLQQLSPAERTVFVLHDVFRFSFDTAASIVGRSPEACRKLASRARRRIEAETGSPRFVLAPADPGRVAERFIAACAGGDLEALLEVLDPDVVGAVELGGGMTAPVQVGRDRVAPNVLRFFGGDRGVTLVSHARNGRLGALAFKNGDLYALVTFEIAGQAIVDIHAIVDPVRLARASTQFRAGD
jgi:RNA polymerase sigma-70 factor (ECF subfamily)